MSLGPFLVPRPAYSLHNTITTTISRENQDGELEAKTVVTFLVAVSILLDNFIEDIYNNKKGRGVGRQQAAVYATLAGRLAGQFGLDGRACLLRFVCDLQTRSIARNTMVGHLLTILFTPQAKGKEEEDLLGEYLIAKKVGHSRAHCDHHYRTCPISVFNYFDQLRNSTSNPTQAL